MHYHKHNTTHLHIQININHDTFSTKIICRHKNTHLYERWPRKNQIFDSWEAVCMCQSSIGQSTLLDSACVPRGISEWRGIVLHSITKLARPSQVSMVPDEWWMPCYWPSMTQMYYRITALLFAIPYHDMTYQLMQHKWHCISITQTLHNIV